MQNQETVVLEPRRGGRGRSRAVEVPPPVQVPAPEPPAAPDSFAPSAPVIDPAPVTVVAPPESPGGRDIEAERKSMISYLRLKRVHVPHGIEIDSLRLVFQRAVSP